MTDATCQAAAASLLERVERAPRVALVLGSGLGDLADRVRGRIAFATNEVDGYPVSTVAGHEGRLVFGRLEETSVVVVQGRAHLYEGHSLAQVTFPIRLAHALGASRLILTNAAGGIHPGFRPGTLMLISDHINVSGAYFRPAKTATSGMSGISAKTAMSAKLALPVMSAGGANPPRPSRECVTPYDAEWLERSERIALNEGVAVRRGTYAWTRGPSYETKAEIRAYRRLGADAVGMSTVPEALAGSSLGMAVLGISTITNPAAGLNSEALRHEDVLAAGRRVRHDLERLVRGILRDLH